MQQVGLSTLVERLETWFGHHLNTWCGHTLQILKPFKAGVTGWDRKGEEEKQEGLGDLSGQERLGLRTLDDVPEDV